MFGRSNNNNVHINNNSRNSGGKGTTVGLDIKDLARQSTLHWDQSKDNGDSIKLYDQTLLDREIRHVLFPLFHSVLNNPPSALISNNAHSPVQALQSIGLVNGNSNNGNNNTQLSEQSKGFLYLFDKNAKEYYMNDGIKWIKTKSNVRMILYNDESKSYKLKTHKKDTGSHVLRRQAFGGVCENGIYWRRFEYKLVTKEKVQGVGKIHIQDFPLLVHYLIRPAEENDQDNNNSNCMQASTPSLNNHNNNNNNNSNNISYDHDNDAIGSGYEEISLNNNNNPFVTMAATNEKKRESPFHIPSITSSSILNLFKKKKKDHDSNNNNNNTTTTTTTNINSNLNSNSSLLYNSNSLLVPTSLTSNTTNFLQKQQHQTLTSAINRLNDTDDLGNTTSTLVDDNYFLDFSNTWSNQNDFNSTVGPMGDNISLSNSNNNILSSSLSTFFNNTAATTSSTSTTTTNDNNNDPQLKTEPIYDTISSLNNNNNNNNLNVYDVANNNNNNSNENNNNESKEDNNNNSENDIISTTTTTTNNLENGSSNLLNSSTGFPKSIFNFLPPHPHNNNNNNNSNNTPSPTSSTTSSSLSSPAIDPSKDQQASISSYSPDNSPSLEQTKVICLVNGFSCFTKKVSPIYYSFWAVFESGIEILALPIAPEVLEFSSPIWGEAAVTYFKIVCKQNGSKNIIQQTAEVPFCFTPSDHRGKLKIALDRCRYQQPLSIIPKFRHSVKHLDLSNNALTNLDFLSGFYRLESLVLSHNKITEHAVFPTLPELQNLDLSHNLINFPKVALFVERLIQSAPYLQTLNLQDNEEYPCPFKVPHHHYNYRIYIISRFQQLTKLDLQAVSVEERKHAHNVEEEIE